MGFAISWVLFTAPLAASILAWVGLVTHWNTERRHTPIVLVLSFSTAAALLACAALAYVQFVRSIPSRDYRVEAWGLLLSLTGTILGLVTIRTPRWFSTLALATSAWLLLLFFLAAATY